MKTATHLGTCQLCGHIQKLPGGLLAKHGYAVQWSQFVGTCRGSGSAPYETSRNLIAAEIAYAEQTIDGLEARAQKLWEDAHPKHFYVETSKYVGRTKVYQTLSYTPADDLSPDSPYTVTLPVDGHRERFDAFSYADEPGNKYHALNLREARRLRRQAEKHREYRQWLRERHDSWASRPEALQPVPPKVEPTPEQLAERERRIRRRIARGW
jgi:hypothetical protein